MMLPEKIKIQVLSDTEPFANLVCSVELLTYRKNDYSLGYLTINRDAHFYPYLLK